VQIKHTITFCDHDLTWWQRRKLSRSLKAIGITLNDVPLVRLNFEISEDDDRYAAVAELQKQYGSVDVWQTSFSDEELRRASWVRMLGKWLQGYPMPDDDLGYLEATYDLANYCNECGVGAEQVRPFRMRSEPKWGRRSVLQLNWVCDEFFVRPALFKEVFEPLGIGSSEVLHHRSLAPLETVVQLDIATVLADPLMMGKHPFETCSRCGRDKYLLSSGGEFPALSGPSPVTHIAKAQEYFGSGGAAGRPVLISQELYQMLANRATRGAEFHAVAGGYS